FQAEDGIRDRNVTGVQTCALPIYCILSRRQGGMAVPVLCRGFPDRKVRGAFPEFFPGISERLSQLSSPGSLHWRYRRCPCEAGGVSEREKCKEIPAGRGVRLGPAGDEEGYSALH